MLRIFGGWTVFNVIQRFVRHCSCHLQGETSKPEVVHWTPIMKAMTIYFIESTVIGLSRIRERISNHSTVGKKNVYTLNMRWGLRWWNVSTTNEITQCQKPDDRFDVTFLCFWSVLWRGYLIILVTEMRWQRLTNLLAVVLSRCVSIR